MEYSTQPKSFTIAIHSGLFIKSMCYVHHTKNLTVEQLKNIINVFKNLLLKTTPMIDILRTLADAIGPGNLVELDYKLQYEGTKDFFENIYEITPCFFHDNKYHSCFYYGSDATPELLWEFLFNTI